MCSYHYEALLFHAVVLVSFWGALRVSEVMAMLRADMTGRALKLGDLCFVGGEVCLTIWMSKTDQLRKGSRIELGPCSNVELCPVFALQEYLALRRDGKGPLFIHLGGSLFMQHQFWAVASNALASLGLVGVQFDTHSFCIGAASTMTAVGYSEDRIKVWGRWCYLGLLDLYVTCVFLRVCPAS